MFVQMQEQLQNQTRNMFSGFSFPGFPGFGAPPGAPAKTAEEGGKKPEDEKKS